MLRKEIASTTTDRLRLSAILRFSVAVVLSLEMIGIQSIPALGSESCKTADPTVVSDVLNCMASAKYPKRETNVFHNISTSTCQTIGSQYLNTLTKNGFSPQEAKKRLPTCDIFAKAAREMVGEELYWASCTGYDPKDMRSHLNDCLSNFIPKYYNSENKLKKITGCQEVRKVYQQALRLASENLKVPTSYVPPNCDDANALVASWTGKDPGNHPCAGFDPKDVRGHIEKCFAAPSSAVLLQRIKSCPDARLLYEQKLREAYGDLPPDYTMARCSELEAVVAQAESKRSEAEAKAQDLARLQAEKNAEKRAIANRRMNELAREAERIQQTTSGAATSLLEQPVISSGGGGGMSPSSEKISQLPQNDSDQNRPGQPESGVNFGKFEQRGIVEALYYGQFESLSSRRNGVLIYISGMHNAFAKDLFYTAPRCALMLDSRLPQMAANSMLGDMGMGPGANRDAVANAGLRAGLGFLMQMAQNPTGIMQDSINQETLKNQARNDALRLATDFGCESDVTKQMYENMKRFVYEDKPSSKGQHASASATVVPIWDRMMTSCIQDYLGKAASTEKEKAEHCKCLVDGLRNAALSEQERQTLADVFEMKDIQAISQHNKRIQPLISHCWK